MNIHQRPRSTRFFGIVFLVVAVLVAAMLVRFAVLGQGSKSGEAPGLVSGRLAPCPDTPNCVCSEFAEDTAHYVAPLEYSGASAESAWVALQHSIEELGGDIAVADDAYIAATFSSALFGFVDDVECRLDAAREQIQIRSASRVGHSDMGVNRARVEAIRRSFARDESGAQAVKSAPGVANFSRAPRLSAVLLEHGSHHLIDVERRR